MKHVLLVGAAVWTVFTAPALAADLDPAKIAEHVKILADDSFEGRAPATAGETKTVEYIIQQYKAAGLQPGGDLADGQRAWTQDVPLARFENKGPVTVGVTAGGKGIQYQDDRVAVERAGGKILDLVAA